MRDMEDSGAGGSASSPSTPRPGGAKASSQMPPEEPPPTIIGRKVKWALDFLGAEKGVVAVDGHVGDKLVCGTRASPQ